MTDEAILLKDLSPAIINYIKGLESGYNQRIKELESKYEKLEQDYALLIHSRFARSSEQLRADNKQPQLFDSEEAKGAKARQEEYEEVRSHKRRKSGRKAIDPKIPRVERIIDIKESEKTCACGARLTRIGEERAD